MIRLKRRRTMKSEAEVEEPSTGIFAFPHGTRPGTCLHQILQEVDFCNLENMAKIVSRNLRAFSIHGFDEVICEMIRKTVSVPLETARPDFTLSRIAAAARLPEMEFYFPISAVTPAKLAQAFTEHRAHLGGAIPSTIDRLKFRPMSGFMKGFIDLVFEYQDRFYLVDWKSNWLGAKRMPTRAPPSKARWRGDSTTCSLASTPSRSIGFSVRENQAMSMSNTSGALITFSCAELNRPARSSAFIG